MKSYKILLESIEKEISAAEIAAEEEARRLAEEEANAPSIPVDDIAETEEEAEEVLESDQHFRDSPNVQAFLALPVVKHAIDLSNFDMYMEENYAGAVYDMAEAAYLFARDYNVNTFAPHFTAMKFRPAPGLRNSTDLDEMGKEFYDALEKAYGMGH